MLKKSLLNSNSWSAQRDYYEIFGYKAAPVEEPIEIKDNDLVLGFGSKDFSRDNIRKINLGIFSGGNNVARSIRCMFLGATGAGKTTQCSTVALDNFVERFSYKFFAYDPKREWYTKKQPAVVKPKVKKLFADFGVTARGYDLFVISPKMLNNKRNVDQEFMIGYDDIKRLATGPAADAVEAVRLLLELVNMDDPGPDLVGLLQILVTKLYINDFTELEDYIEKEGAYYKIPNTSIQSLIRKISLAIDGKVITNNENYIINVLELMHEHDGVVFAGKLRSQNKNTLVDNPYNAVFKILALEILYDCVAYNIQRDRSDTILQSEVVMVLDELDVLAPDNENTTTRDFVRAIFTKARGAGITALGIAQEATLVDKELFEQFDIIFCGGGISDENGKMLVRRGVPQLAVDQLRNLRSGERTNVGTKVAQWCAMDRNRHITKYLPIPPQSAYL